MFASRSALRTLSMIELRRSRCAAATSTWSSKYEPPRKSSPSATCLCGSQLGSPARTAGLNRFGTESSTPSAQTAQIRAIFHCAKYSMPSAAYADTYVREPATLTHPALRAGAPLSRNAGEGAERSEAGEGLAISERGASPRLAGCLSRNAPSRHTRVCACRVAHLRCARGAERSEAGEGSSA